MQGNARPTRGGRSDSIECTIHQKRTLSIECGPQPLLRFIFFRSIYQFSNQQPASSDQNPESRIYSSNVIPIKSRRHPVRISAAWHLVCSRTFFGVHNRNCLLICSNFSIAFQICDMGVRTHPCIREYRQGRSGTDPGIFRHSPYRHHWSGTGRTGRSRCGGHHA